MATMQLFVDKKRIEAAKIISLLRTAVKGENAICLGFEIEFLAMALVASANCPIDRDDVLSCIPRMKQDPDILKSFEETVKAHQERTKEWLGRNQRRWKFILPWMVHLGPDADLKSLSYEVLGQKISVESFENVGELVDPAHLKLVMLNAGMTSLPQTVLCVEGNGTSAGSAWHDEVNDAFETFRGALALSMHRGHLSEQLVGPSKPRSQVPELHWAFAFSDQTQDALRFNTEHTFQKDSAVTFSEKLQLELSSTLDALKSKAQSASSTLLLSDVIKLYVQALDSKTNDGCFLGFWQLAETLTLASRYSGDGKVVADRLAWLANRWRLASLGLKDCLLVFYRKRNRIVHHGLRGSITDHDVNLLKIVCEIAISWLTLNLERYSSTNQLEQLFQLKSTSVSDLEEQKEGLENIRASIEQIHEFNNAPFQVHFSNMMTISFKHAYETHPVDSSLAINPKSEIRDETRPIKFD